MDLTELFIALQLAATNTNPIPVEEVYSYREAEGEMIFYAAADKEYGVDALNPKRIDANKYKLAYEVSINFGDAYINLAQSEIDNYRNAEGDSFSLLESLIFNKTPSQVMELYASSGLTGILLPMNFGSNWGSWAEFMKYPYDNDVKMIFTYKEVRNGVLKEIKAVSSSDHNTVESVKSHWQQLIVDYKNIAISSQ